MKTRQDEIVNACVWTRPRLALFVGMGCDVESTAEEGDLSRADRRRIKVHLDDCGDCRRRWSALVRSMSALSAAATESPVEPHGPTLWEGLAARIEAAESSRPSVWVRFGRAVLPDSVQSMLDRAVRRLDRGLSGLPIQTAWVRDTIAHDLPDRLRGALDRLSRSSGRLVDRMLGALTSPAGLGATAAAGAFLVAASLLHRSEIEAEARIASASAPIPIELQAVPLVLTPARPPVEAPRPWNPRRGRGKPRRPRPRPNPRRWPRTRPRSNRLRLRLRPRRPPPSRRPLASTITISNAASPCLPTPGSPGPPTDWCGEPGIRSMRTAWRRGGRHGFVLDPV